MEQTDFTNRIREWVSIDNKIKKYQEEIKRERQNRSLLASSILQDAENSNMQHAVIQITDGKLKFQNTRITAPLTWRFLESCLNECIENEEQVKKIIKFMKSKREVNFVHEIKRTYS